MLRAVVDLVRSSWRLLRVMVRARMFELDPQLSLKFVMEHSIFALEARQAHRDITRALVRIFYGLRGPAPTLSEYREHMKP